MLQFRTAVKRASKIKYENDIEHRVALQKAYKERYKTNKCLRENVKSRARMKRQEQKQNAEQFEVVMATFLDKVKEGPNYVCCVCHRTWFKEQVKICDQTRYAETKQMMAVAKQCITEDYLHRCTAYCKSDCEWLQSTRMALWICHCCHNNLSRGVMPSESVHNNLAVCSVPEQLACLNNLEQHLVALQIPFMKILALPKGGQNGVHGPVTCVPANVVQTTNVLPRSDVENSLVRVKLKRKLTYKAHYRYEFVNIDHIRQALSYLKECNSLYSDIQVNTDWENVFAEETEVTDGDTEMQPEDSNEDNLLHDRQQHCVHMDTCLQPVNIGQEVLDHYFDKILQVAPGEGNTPVALLLDANTEGKCFPALFPDGRNTYQETRKDKLSLSRYFNLRIMSADSRFGKNIEYIFYAQYVSEIHQVVSNVSIALRKGKGTKNKIEVGPEMVRDEKVLRNLLQHDEGYRFLKPIHGSPPYWQGVQKDLFAMIRQLGIPTWFCSFSSADMRWENLLESILKQEGRHEKVDALDWSERCTLLRQNPVLAARMFDFRWHKFLAHVIMSPCHPIGKVVDYFYRIEFQQRGSPHVHCLFWVENAPQIDKNSDDEVVQFVDTYVSCKLPCDDENLLEKVTTVQQHSKSHSKSCKKKGTTCRFNFPRPPSKGTFICHKPEDDEVVEPCQCKEKCVCLQEIVLKMQQKEQAENILSRVRAAITQTDKQYSSIEELFAAVAVTQDSYQWAYQLLTKKTQTVLKREPNALWINPYNASLLRCWNANMDIQYIVDAYACVVYIISYISKAEREMGLLLSHAQKEAFKEKKCRCQTSVKKIRQCVFTSQRCFSPGSCLSINKHAFKTVF